MSDKLQFQEYIVDKSKQNKGFRYNQESQHGLIGWNKKRFVRVQSSIFVDMFKELRDNPFCSYVTYLNDLIRDVQYSDTPCIEYVSALLKNINKKICCYVEPACSRISNALEIPVVFNVPYDDDDNSFVLSVDCISPECELLNVYEIFKETRMKEFHFTDEEQLKAIDEDLLEIYEWNYMKELLLSEWIEMMSHCINQETCPGITQENKEKLLEDFVSQYIFRKYILDDSDVRASNFCVIHNIKTGEYSLGPGFDFEFAYGRTTYTDNQKIKDLTFCLDNYPQVITHLMTKINQICDRNILFNLYGEVVKDPVKCNIYTCVTQNNMQSLKDIVPKLSKYKNFVM